MGVPEVVGVRGGGRCEKWVIIMDGRQYGGIL